MKTIEIIKPEYFIDNIYQHIDKICKQNKTNLPPRDLETVQRIHKTLINNIEDLTQETLEKTKLAIYKEWKKDQKGFLYIHKGFHTAFKFALEQTIPRTIDEIWQETPGLSQNHFDLLEKTNWQHSKIFKQDMLFQRGTAEYMHNYARYIPEEEYLFRSNSALQMCRKDGIPELERWNIITGAIWQYINSEKIDVSKRKYENLVKFSFNSKIKPNLGIMESIDYSTEK